jgi:glucose/arabinose dehydrogenase
VAGSGRTLIRRAFPALVLACAICAVVGPSRAETAPQPVALTPVASGLHFPVYLAQPPDGTDRFFALEQIGRIRIVQGRTVLEKPFLDIVDKVYSGGEAAIRAESEQGLLGLAFHPDFRTNGRYFLNYTRKPDGATVIAEYRASGDPALSLPAETVLLVIAQPYANHNGGMIEFGPDRFLYIGMGDGGSGGDPENRAQNPDELLGKMLRVDVDGAKPYAIPADNPFAGGGGRPEIFAWGLRNPWRFSFDRETGDLWAGDVGQRAWEEIDVIRRGGNYGWRIMEGHHCFRPPLVCKTAGLVAPVAECRTHKGSRCSIVGGYVYRGPALSSLRGRYVYGDYCSGEVISLVNGKESVLLQTKLNISSFGQDREGELYVVGHKSGMIHRLTPAARK